MEVPLLLLARSLVLLRIDTLLRPVSRAHMHARTRASTICLVCTPHAYVACYFSSLSSSASCHVRPGAVMHRKKKDTPQCPGADKCPLKSAHAPNGPDANCEHNLGCAVCEEQLQKRDERQKEAKVTAAAAAAIAAAATESKQT